MSELKELDDFLDPILLIPIRDKEYRVPAPSAEFGLRLQRMVGTGVKAVLGKELQEKDLVLIADEDEDDFFTNILGDTYQEMIDDGLPYQALKAASIVATIWTTQGFDQAKEFWSAGGKAPAPNRAQRRAKTTPTAAEPSTKKRSSGNGTSTPRARPQARAKAGPKSSPTGT